MIPPSLLRFKFRLRRPAHRSLRSGYVRGILKDDSENSFLVDDQMASPHDCNPQVPEPLSNLVMECVRTNPAKRPQDLGELARRLEIIEHAIHRSMAPASSTGSGAGFRVGAAAQAV